MGNVFKSVAKFLDNALSGGEVDVIVMDASAPLSNQADVAAADANIADVVDAASDVNEDSSDVNADGGEAASADGGEAAGTDGGDTSDGTPPATLSNQAETADADGGESANANASAETASPSAEASDRNDQGGTLPAVQQMLGEGQVAVDAAELESLRVDAGKWKENATELENLKAWKEAGSKENVLQGAVDAADAVAATTKRVSAATQKAIDLKNKMAGN